MKTVEVITRKGCHLCDLALGELETLRDTVEFSVKLTYLEDHPEFIGQYGNDIPVIRVDQNEVCRHKVHRGALIARLSATEPERPR